MESRKYFHTDALRGNSTSVCVGGGGGEQALCVLCLLAASIVVLRHMFLDASLHLSTLTCCTII